MKQFKSLFIATIGLLVLGACSVREDSFQPAGRAIRFTTDLGGYAVKATDTEFESGDQVSLFVSSPINAINVKMVYQNGELVPEREIAWPEGAEPAQCTEFIAVYPYDTKWEYQTDANVFSVRPDQSTREGYAASDIMMSSYMAYPDCETVPLNFLHRMSRFDLIIDSRLAEDVAEVYLSGVYGKARIGVYYSMSADSAGEKGTVKMGCTNRESNEKNSWSTWSAILPPQEMNFKILMTTASGKQYTYTISEWDSGVWMESARKYQGQLVLARDAEATDFSVEVSDWIDNPDMQFGRYVPDEYHEEGEWLLRKYDAESGTYLNLPFEYSYDSGGNALFTLYLNNVQGAVYELAYTRNEINYFAFGLQGNTSGPKENGAYKIEQGGSPLSFAEAGDLILELRPRCDTLIIRPDNDVWSIIGTFGGDNWTIDTPMERVRAGFYQTSVPYFGEEFKFRCNGSWDVNLGLPTYWGDHPANTTNPDNGKPGSAMALNGQNITLEAIGWWVLQLDVRSKSLRAFYMGADDSIFDGYRSYLGKWLYTNAQGTQYAITISDAKTCYKIEFDDVPIKAQYDAVDDGFKVNFNVLNSIDTKYGNAELVFYAGTVDEETEQEYGVAYGDAPWLTLFKGKLADDGQSITIKPGIFDGHPFSYYYIIYMITEGNYAGQYGLWFRDEFSFPQTWTKVND